jgi:hypothetical protein
LLRIILNSFQPSNFLKRVMCLLEVILEVAAVELEEFGTINFHGDTSSHEVRFSKIFKALDLT